ncbi:MAG: NAD(P)/FAD-dependent oxidoreductase [Pedobacter sp.]|uniref:FAD-dependent oxidoreductase n=1 Tax=Pedobacter sp. TaxID=1411316 RepID=UPI003396B3F5
MGNMIIENKLVAIIGGGPGGLTLANLLQRKGIAVQVYERDAGRQVRAQGGTLDLHAESGLKALEAAGLMDAFKAKYRPYNDRLRALDQNAVIFYDEHSEESSHAFGDEFFRPEIDRGPLRDILLDALNPGTLVWDSQVVSIEKSEGKWKLLFKNGSSVVADIVIGADGANSKIRSVLTPIKPVYSGVTILEKNIGDAHVNAPRIYELLKGGKIMAFGDSKSITISAKGDGSIDFYIGLKKNEGWFTESGIDFKDGGQMLDWFQKEFSAWNEIWLELFTNQMTYFIPRPQYLMPLDQYWDAQPDITIIGDAAHVMPPYAGEGVNMAMLDAFELSESLTGDNSDEFKAAIAHYEKQMFKRFAVIGKETLDNTDWMHSPAGLEKLLAMFLH